MLETMIQQQSATIVADNSSSSGGAMPLSSPSSIIHDDARYEMICDRLHAMLKQESTAYKSAYSSFSEEGTHSSGSSSSRRCELSSLPPSSTTDTKQVTNDPWRQPMINWMWSVIDVFQLSPENVALAAYYLDKCDALADDENHTFQITSPTEYQLVSVTALQLAVKMLEYEIFPLSQLVTFLGNTFCEQDIINMELRMMGALGWYLNPPTPYTFLAYYLQLLPTTAATTETVGSNNNKRISRHHQTTKLQHDIYAIASKLIRMVISTDTYMEYPPSIIAYASLIHAMERFPILCVETKRVFALRLQQVANLTTQSPGLREAFSTLASLQQQRATHAPPATTGSYSNNNVLHHVDDLEQQKEEEQKQQQLQQHQLIEVASPRTSIVAVDDVHHHSIVHISSWDYQDSSSNGDALDDAEAEEEGIEVLPEFGDYEVVLDDDEDTSNNNMKDHTTISLLNGGKHVAVSSVASPRNVAEEY